nr:uncharacterized protein LOC108019690 isoform X2 [Drosophila suzukii]
MPLKFNRLCLPLLLFACHLLAEIPQCFHFTWVGAYDNHSNIQTETCDSRVGDFNDIPCEEPLVVTPDDTVPDVKALWQNTTENRENFLCQMSPGRSCVKYSYIFKGGKHHVYVRQREQQQRVLPTATSNRHGCGGLCLHLPSGSDTL